MIEDVYHAERGGMARTPCRAPGEIDFYPLEAGADDLIDRFGSRARPSMRGAPTGDRGDRDSPHLHRHQSRRRDLVERNDDAHRSEGAAAPALMLARPPVRHRSTLIARRRASICARWVSACGTLPNFEPKPGRHAQRRGRARFRRRGDAAQTRALGPPRRTRRAPRRATTRRPPNASTATTCPGGGGAEDVPSAVN